MNEFFDVDQGEANWQKLWLHSAAFIVSINVFARTDVQQRAVRDGKHCLRFVCFVIRAGKLHFCPIPTKLLSDQL